MPRLWRVILAICSTTSQLLPEALELREARQMKTGEGTNDRRRTLILCGQNVDNGRGVG